MNNSLTTKHIIETLKNVNALYGSRILIKLGGAALEDLSLVTKLCEDLALVKSAGVSFVIVHGGGASINKELKKSGLDISFHDGQRITTPEIMDIVEMVLCGRNNKALVRTLNAAGVKSVGLSGADGKTLLCSRQNPMLGEVGTIEHIDTTLLNQYLNSQKEIGEGYIPVVAPVGISIEGKALNVNADWAASKIAQALKIRKLIYLTDQDGIMDAEGNLISKLTEAEIEAQIKSGVVKGGMLAKCLTILDALKNGVEAVHIINGSKEHTLIEELFTNKGIGTICT